LIRKRFYHLIRKIILAQEFVSSKRSTSAFVEISTRMSERLRTETLAVARSDREVLRRTDIRSEPVTRSESRPLLG